MKKNKKSAKVVFLGAFIALAVIAIAGMNMRTLINSDGLMGTARKAGANDAVVGDVLENYTFTSDTAGTGIMGSITDYSQTLTQLKLLASSANQTVTLPLNPGYYTQVKLDTTEVYEAGYDAGIAEANVHLDTPIYETIFTERAWTGTVNTEIGKRYYIIALTVGQFTGADPSTSLTIGSATNSAQNLYWLQHNLGNYVSFMVQAKFIANSTNTTITYTPFGYTNTGDNDRTTRVFIYPLTFDSNSSDYMQP